VASEFPGSPKFLKGALVVFETARPIPTNIIVFQYNPESMTRSFTQQAADPEPSGCAGDTHHVQYPPIESFDVTVELDAADQLEHGNPLAQAVGLHPTLAALELLLYPRSELLILNKTLALLGSAMVAPPEVPLVLFVWGPARVVPVRVTSVSITEEAFDQLLNPIQARVQLGLRTLTDKELAHAGPPFRTLAIVQQVAKEALARSNVVNAAQGIRGMLPF